MAIWKFNLSGASRQRLDMPEGATILSLQTQGEMGRIWALVNPKAKNITRTFATFGTGHELPSNLAADFRYIGTYQNLNEFVWHVFEVLD